MNNPSELLKSRGILETALEYGWIEQTEYWQFPVYNPSGEVIAHRLKRYPHSKAPAKYLWHGEKPTNPDADWYILPNTPKAIKAAQGVAWLANGEPSLLAYHAADVHNVIATTLSEIAVPKSLITMLQVLGVNRLVYPVDKDKAGHDSAVKWRDALRGSSIDFEALSWSEDMPAKADANDAWIACEFDSLRFQAVLKSLQPLNLPTPDPLPVTHQDNSAITETPQGFIDTLIGELGAEKFNRNGWSKNFNCPHHDDQKPSAGINKANGVIFCQVCGSHSPFETADVLGIDWRRFYPQKEAKKPSPRTLRQDNSLDHAIDDESAFTSSIVGTCMYLRTAYPAGYYDSFIAQEELPLSWIKAMLHLSHSKSAIVIHLIQIHRAIRKGLLDPQGFTMNSLQFLLASANRKGIQNTLDTCSAWNIFRILPATESLNTNKVTKGGNNSGKRGRPETYYAINPDTDGIAYSLLEYLEPYLLEYLSGDGIAPLLPSLRDSLGLDRVTWKAIQDKQLHDKARLIQDIISEWTESVLQDRYSLCFEEKDLETPQSLRVRLLRNFLSAYPEGLQIAKHKIGMLLGCSESSLSSLYKAAGVGVKRIKGFYEVENPNGCDIDLEMDKAPLSLNPKLGGIAIAIKAKLSSGKYTGFIYADKAKAFIDSNFGYLDKLWIWVEQPSLLWVMSADEIAEKAKEDAKIAEQKELDSKADNELPVFVASENGNNPQDEPMPKEPKAARKPSFSVYKDRVTLGHKPEFKRKQAALYIHCFTPYRLEGLRVIHGDGDTGIVIETLKSLHDVFTFIAERGFNKQIRTAESYAHPEKDAPVFVPF